MSVYTSLWSLPTNIVPINNARQSRKAAGRKKPWYAPILFDFFSHENLKNITNKNSIIYIYKFNVWNNKFSLKSLYVRSLQIMRQLINRNLDNMRRTNHISWMKHKRLRIYREKGCLQIVKTLCFIEKNKMIRFTNVKKFKMQVWENENYWTKGVEIV